jgi:hypothetical protein
MAHGLRRRRGMSRLPFVRFALPLFFGALAACQSADEAPADAEPQPEGSDAEAARDSRRAAEQRDAERRCDPLSPPACTLADGRAGAVECRDDGREGQCLPLACEAGETFACRTDDGAEGARNCVFLPQGYGWSECGAFDECRPGDTGPCPSLPGLPPTTTFCALVGDSWSFPRSACDTPLVLSFDGAPVEFTHPAGFFDVVGRGASFETDWVSAATPWLAVDLDGDGAIDDGSELFGSMSVLPSGRRAPNGFAALAALDDNGDGLVTPADAGFAKLLLWRDLDQDRRSAPRELRRAADEGLVAIELAYRNDRTRCVGTACEVERAAFRFRDAAGRVREGAVVDVHFAAR